MPATHKQRLQDTLRAELSDVIRREMRDPRFNEGLLSITDVEVTIDLKHATVFISVLGDEKAREDKMKALRGATGVLRNELKRRKAFNNVPSLAFKYDEAMERGTHIYDVMERVKREDAARAAELGQAEDMEASEDTEEGQE